MTPYECAEYLKSDDGITNAHQESATEGQTEVYIYEKNTDDSNNYISIPIRFKDT